MPAKPKATPTVEKAANPSADVHHVIRKLQMTDGILPDVQTVYEVDEAITNYRKAGYRLAFVGIIGTEPGCVLILYVLDKD